MIQPPLLVDLIRGQAFQTESEALQDKSPSDLSPESRTSEGLSQSLNSSRLDADIPQRQTINAISTSNDTDTVSTKQIKQLENIKKMAQDMHSPLENNEVDANAQSGIKFDAQPSAEVELLAPPEIYTNADPSIKFSLATQSIDLPDTSSISSQLSTLSINTPDEASEAISMIDEAINEINQSSQVSKDTSSIEIADLIQKLPTPSINNSKDATELASSIGANIATQAASAMQSQANITPQQTLSLLK
jgi:ArsR family metal-binding transcriptional regulator